VVGQREAVTLNQETAGYLVKTGLILQHVTLLDLILDSEDRLLGTLEGLQLQPYLKEVYLAMEAPLRVVRRMMSRWTSPKVARLNPFSKRTLF
jgi:hypothetical protein